MGVYSEIDRKVNQAMEFLANAGLTTTGIQIQLGPDVFNDMRTEMGKDFYWRLRKDPKKAGSYELNGIPLIVVSEPGACCVFSNVEQMWSK